MSNEELAIRGGRPAKRKPLPEWPAYDERELTAVTRVIQSRKWWRIVGNEVDAFEKEFARYQRAAAALAVSNGTQAIELALSALGVGRGDEVLVPAYTFISTATAVLAAGAVPVMVDVRPDTYCLDPEAAAAAITPRTRAIVPVHMAGHVADMDALIELAQAHGLAVLEDAAHAQGADWKGRRVGALAQAGIFSFQAGKLMTAGEGGLVLTSDPELLDRCFLFHSCGRPKTDRTYQHQLLGTNARLSELQASVLRVQLERLDAQIAIRAVNAPALDGLLREIPGIVPQGSDPRVTRNPHYMYMFRYDAAEFGGLGRMEFVDALIAEGVPAFLGYPAVHQTPVFHERAFAPRWDPADPLLPDYRRVRCPVSEELGRSAVWLHHRTLLGDAEDVGEVAEAVRKIQAHSRRPIVAVGSAASEAGFTPAERAGGLGGATQHPPARGGAR
jgi:3-amino-5-hydroxybenzoate synthase